MKIAFLESFLNIRGTSVALHDYAHFNETILGNESIILTEPYHHRAWHHDSSVEVQDKFRRRFQVFTFTNEQEIQAILRDQKVDVLYSIKCGPRVGYCDVLPNVKNIIHVVFEPSDPRGDVYCVISDFLNERSGTNFPVLPHIVHLPDTTENFRQAFNIPEDAIVFGRYGGILEFDVGYVHSAVRRLSQEFPNIYFLFMNTPEFIPPCSNVIFLEKTTDMMRKATFVNTCDAMIYARAQGETFGLAIGEFSCKNKPIFAPKDAPDQMHHRILRDNAVWFENEQDCYEKMRDFRRDDSKDWNMYKDYAPERVMEIFKELIGC